MPDRYDPKVSVRPGGDRRASEARRDAGGDPLAELAKIVSGRAPPSPAARARVNGAAAEPPPAVGGGDVLGDLETELLNDLQASFATLRDMVPSTPAPARAAAPPPAPEPEPEPEPVYEAEPEPEPVYFDPPAPPAPPPPQPRSAPPLRADRYLPEAADEREPAELAEMFAPMPREPEPEPAPVRRVAEPPRQSPRFVPPASFEAPEPPAERASRAPRLPNAERPDLSSFQMRSTGVPANPPAPPQSGGASRWERPREDKLAAGSSRFAPPRQPARAAPPPPVHEDDDLFDDDLFAAPVDESGKAEDFPLEGFGEDEAYDGDQPPHHEDLASMIEPRRPRGFAIAGAAIALVLVGGVAVAMFRPGGETTTPPVIVADGEPTKITPDVVAPEGDASKLIYDRVTSGEETAAATSLEPGTEPLAALPTETSDSPITRVIIPGGPGIDAPSDDGLSLDGQPSTMPEGTEVLAQNDAEPGDASGPRRVRTVIVKPDGTIVESAAAEEGAAPAAAPAPVAVAPAADPVPAPIIDDTAAISGNGELAITPLPDVPPPVVAANEQATPAPAPAPEPTVVASVGTNAPLDLTQPGAAPAVAPAPAGVASGMLVQVSSQRSEDAARATYRDLQERYPSILGSFEPNIQRAEVRDRGTFYRVRVGPFSSGDAQRLCDDLKAQGGDCILAQR